MSQSVHEHGPDGAGRRVEIDTPLLRARIIDGVKEIWEPRYPGSGQQLPRPAAQPCAGCGGEKFNPPATPAAAEQILREHLTE